MHIILIIIKFKVWRCEGKAVTQRLSVWHNPYSIVMSRHIVILWPSMWPWMWRPLWPFLSPTVTPHRDHFVKSLVDQFVKCVTFAKILHRLGWPAFTGTEYDLNRSSGILVGKFRILHRVGSPDFIITRLDRIVLMSFAFSFFWAGGRIQIRILHWKGYPVLSEPDPHPV